MRNLTLLILFVLLVTGIYRKLIDPLPRFIPGVYIRDLNNEKGEEWDIIRMDLVHKEAGIYRITRRTNFCLMQDGILQEQEYKFYNSTGYYNGMTGKMRENETGALIGFDVRNQLLIFGKTQYRKI